MRLQQNQIWQQGDQFFGIVELERLRVEYKAMRDLSTREGTRHQVTKKEFCRLLKGAVLVSPVAAGPLPRAGELTRDFGGGAADLRAIPPRG